MKLSSQPYKGARDFYPPEQKLLNYIFDVWRRVCLSYGFEEVSGPFLEPFELYAAKSGEELVNDQLYSFVDRGGRKVALRPEMTPTVARMIAARSKSMVKPIKWFSIANFWRYEKPQRGRSREFFQLNADIFGESSVLADFEVFSLGASIMKALGATNAMYEIRVNNRLFMDFLLTKIVGLTSEQKKSILKAVDRKAKMSEAEFTKEMKDILKLGRSQVNRLKKILTFGLKDVQKYQKENLGARQLIEFFDLARMSEAQDIFVYSPQVVRGLDYYTGLVIEEWDKNPKNNRALYGGGRYDNLTDLFEKSEALPATGLAMGDVTLANFLESWDLTPKASGENKVLVTLLPGYLERSLLLVKRLREAGFKTELYLNDQEPLEKQIAYAVKKEIGCVIFNGEKEAREGKISVKNLKTTEQFLVNEMGLEEVLKRPA